MALKSKTIGVIGLVTIALLILVMTGLSFGTFATTDTTTNPPQDGDYIEVPTYGYLACEESDSTIDAPPTGWEEFGSRTISCQQQGSLVQECDVTFKLPSEDEVDGIVSFLGVTKCTEGSGCELDEGDDFTNVYYAKGTLQFLGSNEQKLGYNAEVDFHLDQNEYLYVEYQESSAFGSPSVVEKGQYQVSYRPFFINRYDVFSLQNGDRIEGTEDCTNTGDISDTNYIIENVKGGGELEEEFSDLQYLDQNNLRSAGGRKLYFSGLVPRVPQYNLFDDGMKYCYDKSIYRVEEVTVANGDTYKIADTGSNAQIDTVECCNDGDVPSGYTCEDFEQVPLSQSENASCSLVEPCPIQGYQPTAGGRFYTQECVDGQCETSFVEAECSFDEDCPSGYCDVDTLNPTESECVTREPGDYCGNGVCEASFGENSETCPADCTPPSEGGLGTGAIIGFSAAALAFLIILVRPDDKDKGVKGVRL